MRSGQKLPNGLSEEVYKQLDEYIKSYCGLIFNPVATMDWIDGNETLQSASAIAAVIDSARLKYTMPETVDLIYVLEILDQCRKQNPNIKLPPELPPILQNISDNSTITSALLILTT